MVTAWQALSGMLPSTRGMLVCHSSKYVRLALTDFNKKWGIFIGIVAITTEPNSKQNSPKERGENSL